LEALDRLTLRVGERAGIIADPREPIGQRADLMGAAPQVLRLRALTGVGCMRQALSAREVRRCRGPLSGRAPRRRYELCVQRAGTNR
jgi:hypothetical protein